jgi:hypothetical protein
MAERPRAGRSDGVTIAPGKGRGKSLVLLATAVALACVALLVLFGRPPERSEAPAPPPTAAAPTPEPAAPVAEAPAPAVSAQPKAPPPPVREEVEAVAAAEAAEAEAEAANDTPSGIGLFPPPGTDPIKNGVVVPDDFPLPEGFLRHYQVTDEGQELRPILLFHPDYELLDANGEPIALPDDRVVPPELAPPGMPIEMLDPQPSEEAAP